MRYITLIVGLLVVGCGEFTESTPTTTEKPVKELTLREKVVGEYEGRGIKAPSGTYERIKDGDTIKWVFLENGVFVRLTDFSI